MLLISIWTNQLISSNPLMAPQELAGGGQLSACNLRTADWFGLEGTLKTISFMAELGEWLDSRTLTDLQVFSDLNML